MIPAPKLVGPIVAAVTLALPVAPPSAQKVQHSGTQRPAALEASADEPTRLAGKRSFDDTPSSGPRVDVEFDAALVKEFKAAR